MQASAQFIDDPMKLFNFRRDNAPTKSASEAPRQDAPDEIIKAARLLDLDVAISAHENWKTRLSAYIQGRSTEDFSPERICLDNQCDLGKWLYSEATAHLKNSVAFQYLLAQHKMFHYAASSVVALYQAQRVAEAEAQLSGPFQKYSNNVKRSLEDMKLLARVSVKPVKPQAAAYDEGPVYGIR